MRTKRDMRVKPSWTGVDDVAETLIGADPSLDTGDFTHDDGQEGATDR